MSKGPDTLMPRAREAGLVLRDVGAETVVYDLERDEAHCLNPVAATVWKNCDGQTTVSDMVGRLRAVHDIPVGDDTIWSALVELGRNDLLMDKVSLPSDRSLSRRDVMKRAGLAALALPFITSLDVPAAWAACSMHADGTACTLDCQCTHCCRQNICQPNNSLCK